MENNQRCLDEAGQRQVAITDMVFLHLPYTMLMHIHYPLLHINRNSTFMTMRDDYNVSSEGSLSHVFNKFSAKIGKTFFTKYKYTELKNLLSFLSWAWSR